MSARVPRIPLDYDPTSERSTVKALTDALDVLDRHVRFALKLYASKSDDLYAIAEQVRGQARFILRRVKQAKGFSHTRLMRERAERAIAVLSFLTEYGPYVHGSGVLGRRTPIAEIESVSAGGLPGLGRRR